MLMHRHRSVAVQFSYTYEELTWSNEDNDVMKYLQCKEDSSHHSFVYFREGQGWKFAGNGFDFAPTATTDEQLMGMADKANIPHDCHNDFTLNLYGETLSECRAATSDASGSWMWDGKCTEQGGGVHQICMDQLPADFSVTTGQGPWSEGRADKRHCVCIGAWSLYMTREEDPSWTTSAAWPFCDAIPLSSLTSRYIAKWKDWNGIPANIVLGASKLVSKCLEHRSGPGSAPPSFTSACHLAKAFENLQSEEPGLAEINVQEHLTELGFDCSGVDVVVGSAAAGSSLRGGSGGSMLNAQEGGLPSDAINITNGDTAMAPASSAAAKALSSYLLSIALLVH